MPDQQEVAERLEQLAWLEEKRRVGVNADMISKWERGENTPMAHDIPLLAAELGVKDSQFNLGILAAKGSLYLTRPTLFHYIATADALQSRAADLFAAVASGMIQAEVRQQDLRAAVQLRAEDRLALVEAARHPRVLRPLAGEEKGGWH